MTVSYEIYIAHKGDYSQNLAIIDNSVKNVCIGKQCYGGLALGAMAPGQVFASGPPYGHNNVTIQNNRFVNISQLNLWVSSAKGVLISNNTFVKPFTYVPVANCCPPIRPLPHSTVVFATESDSVTFSNNCIIEMGRGGGGAEIVMFNSTNSVTNLKIQGGGVKACSKA